MSGDVAVTLTDHPDRQSKPSHREQRQGRFERRSAVPPAQPTPLPERFTLLLAEWFLHNASSMARRTGRRLTGAIVPQQQEGRIYSAIVQWLEGLACMLLSTMRPAA